MGGGGKGGGGAQTVGYRYRMGLHMVLCHGPVDAVTEIRVGERTAWGDASRSIPDAGHGMGRISINRPDLFGGDGREGGIVGDIDVLPGDDAQAKNDYLVSRLGAMIPAFRGVLSFVVRRALLSSNNPYIKPWAARVWRANAGWSQTTPVLPLYGYDAWVVSLSEYPYPVVGMDPAYIIAQCLTDTRWGMGYPPSSIGSSFLSASSICKNDEIGLNLIWTRQQPIERFIEQVLDHIGGILYVHPRTGKFELKMLRDDYDADRLPRIGPNEIERFERFERPQQDELPNEITVVYTDWDTGKEATLTVQNLAAIQLRGGVINQRRDYPGVSYQPLAAKLAMRDLKRFGSPLARMTFTLAKDALEEMPLPGDVLLLSYPRVGVQRMVIRVTGVDTGKATDAALRIEAVEDVFGMGGSRLAASVPRLDDPPLLPAAPYLTLAVEAPYWELARRMSRADLAYLTDTDTYVGALAAAGGHGQLNWHLSTGSSASELQHRAVGDYAPLLRLTSALPASELDAAAVPFTAMSNPDRLAAGDYAYLLDASGQIAEAVQVTAVNPTSGTVSLARGMLDTTPVAHPPNTLLIGVGEWTAADTTDRAPGESVFVAATPRTTSAIGSAMLAANGNPLLLTGRQARPYPPGRIRINGQTEPAVVAGDLTITWAHRDRTQQTAYLVRQDEGHIGPETGVTYVVTVKDRDGVIAHTETGIAGSSWTWDLATAAADAGPQGDAITIEIVAERGGYDSWKPQTRSVQRAGYGLRWGQYWGGV